jgi:AcrR family transcriptional regulator
VSPRPYEQRARAEAAEKTRRRIVEAVVARLRERPAEPVSIEQVAADAGVARSTVYSVFGSRAGLFDAVGSAVFERSSYDRLLAAKEEPDARQHLRTGIRAGTEMQAADRDVARALYSMAALDRDAVGGVIDRIDSERTNGMARLAGRLDEQGLLLPGIDAAEAADVLWVLTSFDSFDALYTGRGLAAATVADLLIATAERALCVPEA